MDMKEFKGLCDQITELEPSAPVKSVSAVWGSVSYEEFMRHIRQLNDPSVRLIANFLRGPLFFSDPKGEKGPCLGGLVRVAVSWMMTYALPGSRVESLWFRSQHVQAAVRGPLVADRWLPA